MYNLLHHLSMDWTVFDWILACGAALLVGFSKTGVPGAGILVVPLMAHLFGPRASVGVVLPMLIFADIFAVARYRQHTQWDKLVRLLPWVAVGIALGTALLWWLGEAEGKDMLGPIIGTLVLFMLAVHFIRTRKPDLLVPHSTPAVVSTGAAAGFATTVSNAAGPVMGIYLAGMGLKKEQLLGTFAWYFFIVNCSKAPVFAALTLNNPANPMFTRQGFVFNLQIAPLIALGALLGYWLVRRIPQKLFDTLILALAAAAALNLIF